MQIRNTTLRSAFAAAAVGLLACSGALAQQKPLTWKDSWYTKVTPPENDFAARSGFEEENLAYPANSVGAAQQSTAASAALQLMQTAPANSRPWRLIGPVVGNAPGPVTYTGRDSVVSGRVAAIAVAPSCRADEDCLAYVAAAGGGIWKTEDILARRPEWRSASSGLPTTAMGTVIFDPTDRSGRTLYAGTGEPNGSSDAEAGLGLFRSTDGGASWSLVPGSFSAAAYRSIAAVAIDPADARHIYIGTAVARRGASASNGGRFTPPGAPPIGLYESVDGGQHFTLVFSQPSDPVMPATANGNDFFRGGVTKIAATRLGLKPSDPTRIYFSVMDYGLYRSAAGGGYEQVFASAGGGLVANSIGSRTEFALAPLPNGKLRIYVGDTDGGPALLYRTDDANVASPGWMLLSNPAKGTPGYASFNYCGGQCSYDMPVASPEGSPDVVWIGGQMQYGEIFTAHPPSNGRAVQRSIDGGVSFTDMTNDTQQPALGMHPDQHAIAFVPRSPGIAILGSDGGIVRTDGVFVDAAADCAGRGIAGNDLVDCQGWLAAIPREIISTTNAGVSSLQFQSVSINPQDPANDIIGGTQDNGTWAYDGRTGKWFESVGGDGGNSGINAVSPQVRIHSYYGAQLDVNYRGTDPLGWNWVSDPLGYEAASFYVPVLSDPVLDGTIFVGQQRVWRTQDNGGSQAYLEQHCNEFFGDFTVQCGDWEPLGAVTLTGAAFGTDKGGSYLVALARAPGKGAPLWAATRRGRLFVSSNADAADATTVSFSRIDTPLQPTRFISGIAVDPQNPLHAYVSYSGYDAYTPATPGHVFEVTVDAGTMVATWRDLSANIGDQPVTGVAYDPASGRVYAATDFGVAVRLSSGQWARAAAGLPPVAVYSIALDAKSGLLYAATHGRGVWRLALRED
ncbi:MAG: hypothetical protein KGL25_02870 [Gammaproteobacteria bacterium]|nr:hypothetical protein [Gammaproteobacteria bacterium]